MEIYKEKLAQDTLPNHIADKFTIVINQYDNFLTASHQFLLDMKSARNADLEAHQVELKKLKAENDHLSGLNRTYVEKIEVLSKESKDCIDKLTDEKNQLSAQNAQLIIEKIRLATQKAQLTDEISEMESNNEQLTKALIKADIERRETESALNGKLVQMETEKNAAKIQREELMKKVKQLVES